MKYQPYIFSSPAYFYLKKCNPNISLRTLIVNHTIQQEYKYNVNRWKLQPIAQIFFYFLLEFLVLFFRNRFHKCLTDTNKTFAPLYTPYARYFKQKMLLKKV